MTLPDNIRRDINACVHLLVNGHKDDPPDYVGSLDLMQKVLFAMPVSDRDSYCGYIYQVVQGDAEFNRNDDDFYHHNATALQKALAYLLSNDLCMDGWLNYSSASV